MATLLLKIPGLPASSNLPKLPLNALPITSDGFSGAAASDISGRVTDVQFGGDPLSWIATPAGSYGVDGAGNMVAGSYTAGTKSAALDVGVGDVQFSFKLDAVGSNVYFDFHKNETGVIGTSTTRCYRLNVSAAGMLTLLRKVPGSNAATVSAGVHAVSAGDIIGVQTNGGVIDLVVNGAVVETVDDSAAPVAGKYWEVFQGGTGTVRIDWVKIARVV